VKPEASIGKYEHAPSFMKDNEHITHGYRINFDSPKKILKSLFMVHNESVNIWSHFVPAIIICIVIIGFVFFVDKQNIVQDFERHYDSLSDSFEHYSHSLDNLTLIENMKEMKSKTQN
jgi:adiponectin receptor